MTRKEQISAEATDKFMYTFSPIPPEAKELFETRYKAFCQGAEWADSNPISRDFMGQVTEAKTQLAFDSMVDRCGKLEAKVRVLTEAVELLGNHNQMCDCNCMDTSGIARKALDEISESAK